MLGDHPRKTERGKLCPYPRDMNGKAAGFGIDARRRSVAERALPRDAPAGLFGEPPKQLEFARMKLQPAILYPPVAVVQVERDLARFAKARDQGVAVGKQMCRLIIVHSRPPARMEKTASRVITR